MDCRITSAHKFRTRLAFKQYVVILTNEQSVLTKIMRSVEGENVKTQYNVLGYRIYLYFHDYKLAIENNENGHNDWNTGYEIKKQTTIEQELICKFTKIDPDKDEFYICIVELSVKYVRTLNNKLKKL